MTGKLTTLFAAAAIIGGLTAATAPYAQEAQTHGAEARTAIAAVLGVPVEQIGVRDLDKL